MSQVTTKKPSHNIRKNEAFSAFIKTIKSGRIAHWQDMARAVGVNKDTITEWKKLPEAKQAIIDGIDHSLNQMEASGKKDWRMWKEKRDMLVRQLDDEEMASSPITLIVNQYGVKREDIVDVPRPDQVTS